MSAHPLIERARTSGVPVVALVGFSIKPLGGGQAVGWLDAGPQHANPMGSVHGGILCDVADAAMGMAFCHHAATGRVTTDDRLPLLGNGEIDVIDQDRE